MANVEPLKSQTKKKATNAPAESNTGQNNTPEEELTPQELEAKKAAEAAKAEEDRSIAVEKLIKSKKYFLPIK